MQLALVAGMPALEFRQRLPRVALHVMRRMRRIRRGNDRRFRVLEPGAGDFGGARGRAARFIRGGQFRPQRRQLGAAAQRTRSGRGTGQPDRSAPVDE